MAAPIANRLAVALDDYLAAVVASLTDPPTRRYRSAGPPATEGAECELVAVYAQPMRVVSLPQPGELPAPIRHPRVRLVTLVAEVWRSLCIPSGVIPVADLDADGVKHANDGWALVAGLTYRLQSTDAAIKVFKTLDDPECTVASQVDVAEVLEPQGGYAGWRASVVVML